MEDTAVTRLLEGPFTTSHARDVGVGRGQLQRLCAAGVIRPLFRGVYLGTQLADDPGIRAAAIQLSLPPTAVASHLTAAWLLGVDLRPTGPVEVLLPRDRVARQRPGLVIRHAWLAPDDVVTRHGVRLTSPSRTALDLARSLNRTEATVMLDALLHAGTCTVQGLVDRVGDMRGWRGVRRARAVLDILEPRSESPMETRLRLLLVDAGLPRPVAQYVVREAGGGFVARVDLAYPGCFLAIEYDGREAHLEPTAFGRDRRRQNALLTLGWQLLRYTGSDVHRRASAVVAEVRRQLHARAA